MTKCAVLFCKSYSGRTVNISYHRFPLKPSRKIEWVRAIRREQTWIPRKHTRICSLHFEPECYNTNSKKQRKLRKDAVPTLNFPEFGFDKSTNATVESLRAERSSNDFSELSNSSEPTSNASVDEPDETVCPEEETIDTQTLKITLARIRANPQLYIGIPENCYHLIDIIHKQTDIPTTHILLCLKKIKLDTHFGELADQFGVTADEASDIFTTNVPVLANVLHCFVDDQDSAIMLQSEQNMCVIDSLEIHVQPSSEESRELTQTERGNTVKYVVCCTQDGYINYVSPGYGGRQSDERLLEDTNYLDRLNAGDSVILNGLKNVEPLLLRNDLKIVKPRVKQRDVASFWATENPMNDENEPSEDQIKGLVQRIREFTMVKGRSVLSLELVRVLDEAVVISCALINLQSLE